jgi:uncharacterized protein YjiS (DUF1127 family)
MRKPSQRSKATARRREVHAYATHALAANGFGGAAVAGIEQRLKSARARPRAQVRLNGLAAVLDPIRGAVGDLVRSVVAWWKRRREASATYAALAELDARTLHDLGFDRSELSSVAAEIAGQIDSDRTRAHAVRRLRRSFR